MKCPYIRKSEITQSIEKTNSDDETGVYDKRIVNMSQHLKWLIASKKTVQNGRTANVQGNTHKHTCEC